MLCLVSFSVNIPEGVQLEYHFESETKLVFPSSQQQEETHYQMSPAHGKKIAEFHEINIQKTVNLTPLSKYPILTYRLSPN